MSNLIFEGAEFASYADFQAALQQYCQQNAVNGVPLHFLRQGSEKLKPNAFKGETIDADTIAKFVYKNLALVCSHRKKKGDETAVNCHGRISFRFDKVKKLILVSSYDGVHTNHPDQSVMMLMQQRAKQEKVIFNLIEKLPVEVLDSVQEACETILRQWGDDNNGVTIAIIPIDRDENEANQIDIAQPLQHTDSETDLQQYLLNRSVVKSEPVENVEQDPIVDSSDESSSDDNDDIHPQLLVVAEYNASQDKSADLIDKSPTVPKISDVQKNDSSADLAVTNTSIVSFAGANDADDDTEMNNNTSIDNNSPTTHQNEDLLEQSVHDVEISPSNKSMSENSSQKLSPNPTQMSSAESMVPETQFSTGYANNGWVLPHNVIVQDTSNRPANESQSQNDDMDDDIDMVQTAETRSQQSHIVEPTSAEDLEHEPEAIDHDEDGTDFNNNDAGEEDVIMQSEDFAPIDELMPDTCESVGDIEHDDVVSSQIPTKKSKLDDFIDLTQDEDKATKPKTTSVSSAKDGKKKAKFRNLRLKATPKEKPKVMNPLTWQSQPPKVLKKPNELPEKEPVVVPKEKPKAMVKTKQKKKENTREKYGLRLKSVQKAQPNWRDEYNDDNVFEDAPPSNKLKKKQ